MSKFLKTSTLAVAVAVLCAGRPAMAQDEPASAIFTDVTEVNVVNVEVVVTDKQGQPVAGLTRDDFELRENGRPVKISNFYAVDGGRPVMNTAVGPALGPAKAPAPAEIPAFDNRQNHLIVFIDNANIKEINRKKVFKRLEEFLATNWRPNLWVMLATNDRTLTIRQDFTADSTQVYRALDEIAATTSAQPRLNAQLRNLVQIIGEVNVEAGSGYLGTKTPGDIDQETYTGVVAGEAQALLPLISSYSQERYQHIRDSIRILEQFVTMAAGMPGRKSVLYVSDGLTLKPGEALLEGFRRYFQILDTVGQSMSPDAIAARDDATPHFRDLVTHANSSGVTFYTLDASPSSAMSRGSAENQAGSGGNFGAWKDTIESTEQYNRQDSLVMMAEGTGGRYGLTPSTFGDLFSGIWSDFDNYYSLGFVADRIDSDRKRDIKVKLRDGKGYKVSYRHSFRDKTADQRAAERAQAALLIEGLDNPLGITVEARGRQQPQDDNYVVQFLVKLDLDKLVLLPEGDVHRGQVSMYVAVRDEKGRASGVRKHMCPIRIPSAEIATARDKQAACGLRLLMREGPQKLVVSVLDEVASVHSTTSLMVDVGGTRNAALSHGR